MSGAADVLVVPYGADQWSLRAIRLDRSGAGRPLVSAPFPCVAVEPRAHEPLRLNNAPYALGAAAAGATPVEALRAHFKHLCRPWDRLAHRFVDAYLDHLAQAVAADFERLRKRAEAFGGAVCARGLDLLRPTPAAARPPVRSRGDADRRRAGLSPGGFRLLAGRRLGGGPLRPGGPGAGPRPGPGREAGARRGASNDVRHRRTQPSRAVL